MTQAATDVTRDKLVQDFRTVIADTEELMKSAAAVGGEKASAMRANVEQNLKSAREKLAQLEQAAVERTKAAARATDTYVHENPWQSIGITAGVGVLVGITIGLLLNRK
ncbi:MAG: YqjD family protein [Burkholderiales bacterium]